MNKKTWIIFSLVCVVILGGLALLSTRNRVDVSSVDINKIQPATAESGNIADHTIGKGSVTLIEYGDFQCPSCGGAHPNVKTITDKYKDQMTFVFRNLPITAIHPNALAAAAAVEAAGLQGKYWEMHDLIFENQSAWSNLSTDKRTDTFVGYARQVGIKTDQFTTDLSGSSVKQKLDFDRALARKADATGTPTFTLNGEKVSQAIATDIVQGQGKLLDEAIVKLVKAAEK